MRLRQAAKPLSSHWWMLWRAAASRRQVGAGWGHLGMLRCPSPASGLCATQRPPPRQPAQPPSFLLHLSSLPPSLSPLSPPLPSPPSHRAGRVVPPAAAGRGHDVLSVQLSGGERSARCARRARRGGQPAVGCGRGGCRARCCSWAAGAPWVVGAEHGAAAGLLGRLGWWVRLARTAALRCRSGLADL